MEPFYGMIMSFAGRYPLRGWRPCDGASISINENTALFSLLGDRYGGDARTFFQLPDLRDAAPSGSATGGAPARTDLGSPTGTPTAKAVGVSYQIAMEGFFPPHPDYWSRGDSPAAPFIGAIIPWAGNFTPTGWLPCDGSLLTIASNTPLFAIIGTIYGGDGHTTFAVPDLRGRVPLHAGQRPGLPSYTPGEVGQLPTASQGGDVSVLEVTWLIAAYGSFPTRF